MSEDHEYLPGGPNAANADGKKNIDHANEDTMVAVMRNANLLKNVRMHSQSMEPETTVVTALAVIEMPMVMSACCTRS